MGLVAPTLAPRRAESHINDMTGAPVYLDGAARKTMIFAPITWHYLTVDNTAENIYAVSGFTFREAEKGLLGQIFPGLLTKREALTQEGAIPLGAEQVLLEQPDAVFCWSWFADVYANIAYPGLVQIESAPSESLFTLLGAVTGNFRRVEWLLASGDMKRARILSEVDFSVPEVTVVVLGNDDFFVWNRNFGGFNKNLRSLNARNMAENLPILRGVMNIEVLLLFDPDVLLLSWFTNRVTVADIYADPRFKGLKAVKNRRVYKMPRGASRMEGPVEEPLLLLWLNQTLHMRETKISLASAVKQTYYDAYGYTLSEPQINAWLHMEENTASCGYASLFGRE